MPNIFFIPHFAATRNDEIKFKLRRFRVVRTIRFAGWNARERDIERMSFGKIERIRIAPERDRNFPDVFVKLSLGRFAFLFFDVR